jgi:beta-glucanase (GH16 family)
MSNQRRRLSYPRACAIVAIGLLAAGLVPAAGVAGQHGHGKAAAQKKKCKKRSKSAKKCKAPRRGGSAPVPSAPAPGQSADPARGPAPAPDPDACGARIPKSTGGYWDCTFSDDFDGSSLDPSKWVAQRTDTSGYLNGPTACFVDSPNNVSVSNGTLKLTAREEAAPFNCAGDFDTRYTSGMVSTAQGRFGQTYGRYEIRAKVPPAEVKGLQTSLWLWPVDSSKYGEYPASGEIDIAEMFSQYPDRAIPYVHYDAAAGSNVTNTACMVSRLSAFHAYTLEWTASGIRISYDGQTCLVHTWNPASPLSGSQPFDQPFFIALTQALGVGTNEFDPASTPLPATTTVDYVRVWK